MLELLTNVRTAMVLYPKSTKPHRVLCSLSKEQRELLTVFDCAIPEHR